MSLRELWGVNGEGIVTHRAIRPCGCDPDEFSYDDTIRDRYLTELHKRRKIGDDEPIPLEFWEDPYWRSESDTCRFLGYPDLPVSFPEFSFIRNGIKSKYSFEEKFVVEGRPTMSQMCALSDVLVSVVSLTSFLTDDHGVNKTRLFTCSGFVIDITDDSTIIVTSACLVCHADDDGNLKLAEHLKIEVRCGNNETRYGSLLTSCLNYNLAFIEVKGRCPVRPLFMHGGECSLDDIQVFAIGHHYLSGEIMAASGRTALKENPFDCAELMFSTCKITKCGIGGPLVDRMGELIGINFYDKNDTPYLPTCIILKCWYHVHCNREVMQPYLGWKLRFLDFDDEQEIYVKHQISDVVAVHEVKRESPAHLSGIRDGDFIVDLCDEPAKFIAQYSAALLDKKLQSLPEVGLIIEVKIVRGEDLIPVSIYTSDTLNTRFHDVNRWRVPKIEWEVIQPPKKKLHSGSDYPDEHFDYYLVML